MLAGLDKRGLSLVRMDLERAARQDRHSGFATGHGAGSGERCATPQARFSGRQQCRGSSRVRDQRMRYTIPCEARNHDH